MIVQAPDGKNIDFGDLPPEQVQGALQKLYPPSQPDATQDAIKGFSSGIGQGAMGLVTAPLDLGARAGTWLANKAGSALGGPDYPQASYPPSLTAMAQKATGLDYQAQTVPGQYAQTAGQFLPAGGKNILTSLLAAMASETAGQATKGSELEPYARVAGGIAGGSAAGLTGAGINAAKTVFQPFTQGGRQQIVGNALNTAASNADQAAQRMAAAKEFVPGSSPTTAEASGDYGLIALQKGVRNENPLPFAERNSQQNTARNLLLDGMAGTPEDITAAKLARDTSTGPMREDAFAKSQQTQNENSVRNAAYGSGAGKVDMSPVIGQIRQILSSSKGNNPDVRDAMNGALKAIGNGTNLENPAYAYEIKKSMQTETEGLMNARGIDPKSAKKLAGGTLTNIYKTLDNQIEKAAPGYKNYLSEFASQSKPINQMDTLQDIKSSTMLSAPDSATGHDFFSQPKWSNVVQANRNKLKKTLSNDQITRLDAITADLDRGASLNNAAIKTAGSDTYQNLSLANFLGSVLGRNAASSPFAQTLGRPMAWVYKLPEKATNQLMVDAMLDPMLGRQLMQKATPTNIENIMGAMKKRAIGAGYGSLINPEIGPNKNGPLRIEIRPSTQLPPINLPTMDRRQ